jgi:hypothetical protein
MDNYKSASIIVAALATCQLLELKVLELKDHNYCPGRMVVNVPEAGTRLASIV